MDADYSNLSQKQKPSEVQTIGILTLISGIINILGGLGLTIAIVIGTIGIGIICAPLTILPTIVGIFEVIYASKLLSDDAWKMNPPKLIAILQICMIIYGNVISLAIGIVALVLYDKPHVKEYFSR